MASTVSSNKNDSEYDEIIDSPAVRNKKIDLLVAMIQRHKGNITFYTGAGISTGAGIPDFRSGIGSVTGMPAGKWCQNATRKDWSKNEKRVNAARTAKTTSTLQAIPTQSHMALVAMAKAGMLRGLISQNCDGLHRRSGFPPELLAELHGNTNLEYCGWCGKEYMRDFRASSGRRTAGRVLLAKMWPQHKKNKNLINPRRGRHYTGRRCMVPGCNQYLFDSVIDFGDNLPEKHINRGYEMAENCELCIVLGSRCSVSPACDMPIGVGQTPGKQLVVVNLQRTQADDFATLRIGAKIDEVMVPVMEKLGLAIPEFVLSRCVRVKNHGKMLTVGGFDPDGTPNDLIWNVQARMMAKQNDSKPPLPKDTKQTNNDTLHQIMVKVNKDCPSKRAGAPKPGDSGAVVVWPWLNQRNPGHARVAFVTGGGKGNSYGVPPTMLNVQDTAFITKESEGGKALHTLPSALERIERLWTDRQWYPAIVSQQMAGGKLRLLYPESNEAEDVDAATFIYGKEWRYPRGSVQAQNREAKAKTSNSVMVVNAGECRGSQLLHSINIPQPDANGKIQCGQKTMPVGKDESVQVDTLRLMFRSHYREPPLTLPTPPPGPEQCYQMLYSPARGTWETKPFVLPATATSADAKTSASAAAAVVAAAVTE